MDVQKIESDSQNIENQPQLLGKPPVKILKTGTRDIRVEELKFGKSNCGY